MNIPIADRRNTAAEIERIERQVQEHDFQRAHPPTETRLVLGRNVRKRWQPKTETRAAVPTRKRPLPLHVDRLTLALETANKPAATAALSSIMQSAAPDDYDGSDDSSGTSSSSSSTWQRVAAAIASAAPWAAALVDWLAQPDQANQDPHAVADRTASDAAVQTGAAGVLDQADANGNKVRFVAEDGSCAVCKSKEGTYEVDSAPELPVHSSCSCELEEVKQ